MHFGSLAQLGNIIQYLNYRFSFFILNEYSGLAAVGIYSVSVTLVETVWIVSGSIALVEYSKISNIRDNEHARRLAIKLSKGSFLITLFLVSLLLCISPDWFAIIFGRDFTPVYRVNLVMSEGFVLLVSRRNQSFLWRKRDVPC